MSILDTKPFPVSAVDVILSPQPTAQSDAATVYDIVDLESDAYSTLESVTQLGLKHLKAELERRGLKAGGTLDERAARLFSVRGLEEDKISDKIKAKPKK